MRIAIFTDTYAPEINGVARTLKRFTHYLEKKGIPYQVFAPESGTVAPVPQVKRFASLPFALYPECRLALPNPLELNQSLQEFKPSLIHVATPFNIGLFGVNYGKKHSIPLVASYHTHFDDYLTYYNLDFLQKWIWNYMRWFHRPFKKVFVPSQNTREKLIKHSIHHHIGIWSRGIDHNLYSPAKRTHLIREKYGIIEKNILLYVGRIAPEKDIDIAMETFYSLPPSLQKESHLIIAGDGPLYKTLSEKHHSQITFTGFVEGEELAALYASSDIFLFPSSTETFGNVVLESLASGTPVVGANAGGVQELIHDRKTGILCTPRKVDEFVDAVIILLSHDSKRKEMGNAAREYALSKSWDAIFDELLLQYSQMAHSPDSNISTDSRIQTA